MAVYVSTGQTYADADIKHRNVGDVFYLNGERIRLTKKTTTAIAVEPYGWLQAAEDCILAWLGSWLP